MSSSLAKDSENRVQNSAGVSAALRKVATATERLERAREDVLAAILAARKAGHTYAEIAVPAGLTRQRVAQIVDEATR